MVGSRFETSMLGFAKLNPTYPLLLTLYIYGDVIPIDVYLR